MKGFRAPNGAIDHAAWVKSRRASVPLGKLAAIVALEQKKAGRDFLAEDPQGSDLWKLPQWQIIAKAA